MVLPMRHPVQCVEWLVKVHCGVGIRGSQFSVGIAPVQFLRLLKQRARGLTIRSLTNPRFCVGMVLDHNHSLQP